jgi:hypothetical protein
MGLDAPFFFAICDSFQTYPWILDSRLASTAVFVSSHTPVIRQSFRFR